MTTPEFLKTLFESAPSMKPYNHEAVERELRTAWERERLRERINERNSAGPVFSFLDGPPYTSGKVHIGTTLNKTLKDAVLRWRRMQGYAVFDRAGYDMHGLPTEQPTMRTLGLHTNADIEAYGVERFIAACREWCLRNKREMDETFTRLGIWLDFENAYQPITPEFTSGVWFLIKRAHEQGRLYEGLRTMAWDPVFETACAKHELEYVSVKDQSVYVKFRVTSTGNDAEYLVVWTTTPWTIPLNLAIMVNPDVAYARVRVGHETWILAEKLVGGVMHHAGIESFTVENVVPGGMLDGMRYEHFFTDIIDFPNTEHTHTVVLSREYVTDEDGTGLVHCAPGCGPEDYEVGVENGLPAFNPVASDGSFPASFAASCAGLKARTDDREFVKLIGERGALVAKRLYTHDYPHSERSKKPVIYRATRQWFFNVSDLKDAMVAANESVTWQPAGGKVAFRNWLTNLRDNSITKQRYWGTAAPIWRNETTGEIVVIGSVEELEERSGTTLTDVHKPAIDAITIPSRVHPGTVLTRIPDVLDVWVDAGSAAWNAFDYPRRTDLFERHYPADFIIEGVDQYRGWFNLLMIGGYLAFGKASFTNVHVHGYINDSQGRKMSKSIGNYITPEEVLPTYGVDALRLSLVIASEPGEDTSYGIELVEQAYKNLAVLWSLTHYLLDLCMTHAITPRIILGAAAAPLHGEVTAAEQHAERSLYGEEERYLLSRLASTIVEVTAGLERYHFSVLPKRTQALWLELSRTYVQLVREKANGEERQQVADLLYTVLRDVLALLAPVCPFISDALWRTIAPLAGESGSVHERTWPVARTEHIDVALEESFTALQALITAGLSAREKIKQGVRWPLRTLAIRTNRPLEAYDELLKRQLNVRTIVWNPKTIYAGDVEPNFSAIAKTYGKDTQRVATLIKDMRPQPPVTIEGFLIEEEHVKRVLKPVPGYVAIECAVGTVFLEEEVSPELVEEGYARELTRAIQALRKELGFAKRDAIELHIGGAQSLSRNHLEEISRRTNATLVPRHVGVERHEHIRERTYSISARKILR
jgi:isoleucyl-tRNA synthetase